MPLAGRRPPRALQVGPRTYLRRPVAADEREFLARARASRPLHRSLAQPPLTHSQYVQFLRLAETSANQLHVLCRREDGALCGVLNLSDIRREPLQSANLGYYALAPFVGLGYMTEGVQLVLRQAFIRLKLHRIEASVQPGNLASIRLVLRSGFHEEGFSRRLVRIGGRWRDHLRFAILAEDWRALRAAPAHTRGGS